MNGRQTQIIEDPWESMRPNKLRAVIIYETLVDGMRAKRFSDQVIAKVDNGQDFAVSLNAWSLEMLGIPQILNLAGVAAATADIVKNWTGASVIALGAKITHQTAYWRKLYEQPL